MFVGVVLLVGCAEGGSGGSGTAAIEAIGTTGSRNDLGRYATSLPLTDNSNSSAYKVLLMGNSHVGGLGPILEQLIVLGQPNKQVDVQVAPHTTFLAERVNDGVSEQKLESEQWTHVILQAQKYSSSGANYYPTVAAEYWVRGSKELGATPIMFPEHPRQGNTWEAQTLWDLHTGIATRENVCVAPVGFVWDEVLFRAPYLDLYLFDGNHASETGALITALVFYQIITGQPVESLPGLSDFNIDSATEQVMKETVSSLLFAYAPCAFEV